MNRITIILLTGVYLFLVSACSEPEDAPPVGADLEGDIIFSSNRTGAWEVYIMDIDGSDLVQLTDNNYLTLIKPKFSPDGSRIYFAAKHPDYQSDIIIMNRDGTGQLNLTDSPVGELNPFMSPDGLYIGYTRDQLAGNQIAIMNSDGSNKRLPADNIHHAAGYDFSPAGDHILCTGIDSSGTDYNVFLVPVDGSAPKNVTRDYNNLMGFHGTGLHSVFYSPDGSQIVFNIEKSNLDPWNPIYYLDIYTIESDGSNLVQLTSNEQISKCLGFSLDGERILYSEWEVAPIGDADLMTVNTDGTNLRNITNSAVRERTRLFIDGNRIVYDAASGATGSIMSSDIYIIDTATGITIQLTDDPTQERHPDVFMP